MAILHRIGTALLIGVGLATGVWLDASPGLAQDWMYRRSYFSHRLADERAPPHPVPESRSAYRTAYYREGFTFEFRSGYRVNNFVLQNGGRVDRTYYREEWFEVRP